MEGNGSVWTIDWHSFEVKLELMDNTVAMFWYVFIKISLGKTPAGA